MDIELTVHELNRLEAERKLRTIPQAVLETAWVREAQVEAVTDAVLAVALGGDAEALARARHAGEWSARIAAALPGGPDPSLARRVGVLSQIDAVVLERIAELRHIARPSEQLRSIASVAREFDARISPDEHGRCASPHIVLRAMLAHADDVTRPIVTALAAALQPARHARVA
ncbi:MAG TPA: hypothetical protein VMG98_07430 [Verrucomicrobiae bacterium]|nr:hypothetical protein [Verrucomicrobiae bacterium]